MNEVLLDLFFFLHQFLVLLHVLLLDGCLLPQSEVLNVVLVPVRTVERLPVFVHVSNNSDGIWIYGRFFLHVLHFFEEVHVLSLFNFLNVSLVGLEESLNYISLLLTELVSVSLVLSY